MKEPEDNEKYFSIELNKEETSKIVLILLFSIIYFKYKDDKSIYKKLLMGYF